MLIYILVVIFPFLIEELYKKRVKVYNTNQSLSIKEKKIRWKYIFFAALPMFFLIAFRNQSLGADTNGYLEHFQRMINTPWGKIFEKSRMEHGYIIFVKLITCFTHNPLMFQIIYTTIYLFAITSFVNNLDKNHFMVLFLFGTMGMYMFMFTGVRQCLAICICLFAFRYVKRRKIFPFALSLLVAFYFHKSSILFAAAYLIYNRKLSWGNILLYIIFTLVTIAFLDVIQEWFNDQLDYNYGVEGNTGGIIFSIIMFGITCFSIFTIISNKELNEESQGLINIGIIATAFWGLRILTRVAERPSYYFLFFSFAALAYAMRSIKKSDEKDIVKIIVILLALALYIYKFFTSFSNFVPYSFYSF